MTPEPEMTLKGKSVDCPHCGQDLRLSPDAKDELTIAYEKGHAAGVKESSSKYTPLMSYVRHRDNCSWKKETRCACRLKKWIYRLTGAKE